MESATSPESQLQYSIADRSDQLEKLQKGVESFELRAGPSDVTSYHDFHNLQIAFQNIWTEVFDERLSSLGKQLFEEYVKLKDFSDIQDADPVISTIDDLRNLMETIRRLTNVTVQNIPAEFQPNQSVTPTGFDTAIVDAAKAVVDPAGAVVSAILKGLGPKTVLTWESFSGQFLPDGDLIIVKIEENVPEIPANQVTFVLTASPTVTWWKAIQYTDPDGSWEIWTEGDRKSDSWSVEDVRVQDGALEFKKAKIAGVHTGMYVMAGLGKLRGQSRVTFAWMIDSI